MKPKLIAYITLALFIAFAAIVLAGDSTGVLNTLRDTESGNPAKLLLLDNHDGTKTILIKAVIVTPTPSSTNTPTPTATATPTA